ncbi:hypothetical protein [Thermogemmatispora sp.]|uniref:hypothetical protein n=1 Tax=Thermogemmatispora sp. TaxID=1968838 RepID=UPI0035E44209
MQWRSRLLQVAIILFVLLLVNLVLEYSSAQGSFKQALSALFWVLPILLLALGVAALWLAYTRQRHPQVGVQDRPASGNRGLLLFGWTIVIVAILFLLQNLWVH